MSEDLQQHLDAETLNRISGLELKARLIVEGFVTGLHASPYKGSSVEFAEHREYVPGDDLRRLDWKVFAKSDRFYIKEYEEETNLKAYVVLDTSKSMEFSSSGKTKLEYGRLLAAALAWLVFKQQDAVALALFASKVNTFLPPASNPSHLRNIFRALSAATPADKSDLGVIFHELADRLRQRSLIVVISDLFDDVDRLVSGLNHMAHRGHDVVVFQTLDPAELTFPFERMTRFEGLEVDARLLADPRALREAYLAELHAFQHRLKSACLAGRMDFTVLDTSKPLGAPLASYLAMRGRSR